MTAKNSSKGKSKTTATKKPVAAKKVAPKKAAAKKPVAKAAAKVAQPKPSPVYMDFIANLSPGDRVTVYNTETGAKHTTTVLDRNTKLITTQRSGSKDAPLKFTAKGTGTEVTGASGLKLMPFVMPKMVRAGGKRKHRATVAKFQSALAVEANVEQLLAA